VVLGNCITCYNLEHILKEIKSTKRGRTKIKTFKEKKRQKIKR
jgi:hypothetical protein